mmetsp:Transcript_27323/g.59739  ORF Transcript_27323/g.59739 Transcript_27323/m.59739 type:complete len:197 (-) Transcript_27323:2042-2632(-)
MQAKQHLLSCMWMRQSHVSKLNCIFHYLSPIPMCIIPIWDDVSRICMHAAAQLCYCSNLCNLLLLNSDWGSSSEVSRLPATPSADEDNGPAAAGTAGAAAGAADGAIAGAGAEGAVAELLLSLLPPAVAAGPSAALLLLELRLSVAGAGAAGAAAAAGPDIEDIIDCIAATAAFMFLSPADPSSTPTSRACRAFSS